MKTVIYIEDGHLRIIFSAESEFEREALSMFANKPLRAQIIPGSFYDLQITEGNPAESGEMIAAGEPRPDIE